MKKIVSKQTFRRSTDELSGDELPPFGIAAVSSTGMIRSDQIDQLLNAVEMDPTIHIASFDKEGWGYNCFKPNMSYYFLCRGESDPDIEIDPNMDWEIKPTAEEVARFEQVIREIWDEAQDDPLWDLMTGHNKWNPNT